MSQLKACLFDLDGTLVDTVDDLADAMEQAMNECGLGNPDGTPHHTRAEYSSYMGGGVKQFVELALEERSTPELVEKLVPRFVEIYNENCTVKSRPYDGILTVLEELQAQGVAIGIVTNKPEKQARELADFFFAAYGLRCVYGSVADRPNKPDPTSAKLAMNDCGSTAENTLFIGDSDVDVYTAHNAGLTCAAVTWGFRAVEELREAGADILVDHPTELLQYF